MKLKTALLTLAIFSYVLAAHAGTYDITVLNGVSGSDYSSRGSHLTLNNVGDVTFNAPVAWYPQGGYVGRAAINHSGGSSTIYGTLGGSTNESGANGINDLGQAVGWSETVGTFTRPTAALFFNGTVTSLGFLRGGDWSIAYSINNLGAAVGYSRNSLGTDRAALFANGTVTDLGALLDGSYSYAYGINDHGQAVGQAYAGNGARHGVLYENGTVTDLGTLGGDYSYAVAINNAGVIVGAASDTTGHGHAVAFQNGTIVNLETTGFHDGTATAINSAGQIIGYTMFGMDPFVPFIYSNGVMKDVNDYIGSAIGWTIDALFDINDSGQLLASGHNDFGQSGILLLTAVDGEPIDKPSDVPEPATLALLVFGLAGIGFTHHRRS